MCLIDMQGGVADFEIDEPGFDLAYQMLFERITKKRFWAATNLCAPQNRSALRILFQHSSNVYSNDVRVPAAT
jgi:hypothetical protein